MPLIGASGGFSNLPVEQIRTMRGQGMDNNQIIQSLQRSGYSSTDIFDAMNQADVSTGDAQGAYQNQESDFSSSTPSPNIPNSSFMQSSSHTLQGDSSTEELVEAIIDEKWNELVKDLSKIIEWKNSMNTKFVQIEQKFSDLKSEFDTLHSSILNKIETYDKNIVNVGAEVKAMEKVFSKVLPVFTENVSELSRISKDMKSSSSKK